MTHRRTQSRRQFLQATALLSAGLVAAPSVIVRGATQPGWTSNPFSLGIASGVPSSDGFVLWTRLIPDPSGVDPMVPGEIADDSVAVNYEIATDESMRNIVRRGIAAAEKTYAYSVHEVVHGLKPNRPYWYRFHSGDATSAIGCTRTAPRAGAALDRLKLSYFSCSHYETGYFSAYRHAARQAPDLAVFLGDYIYEYSDSRNPVVRHHARKSEARTLSQYRGRYTQYRLDPDLQAIHAACPALMIWDDHEVQNDYADKWSQTFDSPQDFLRRRAAAYQAFYEHMPLLPSQAPNGSAMQICHAFGDLLSVHLVDGRQYRSREACYGPPGKGHGHVETNSDCPERLDEARSMIGLQQETSLFNRLAASSTRWNLLAQDVMMAQLRQKTRTGEFGYWTDDWNGYPASRKRLLQHLHDSKTCNPVVISGDIHSFWTSDLKLDFDDTNSPTVASELVGTSVSSNGPPFEQFAGFLPDNPHIKFFESRKRGFVSLEIARKQMTARFKALADVTDRDSVISDLAVFAIEDGRAGAAKA
ncbi:MAG: alkaline phosphatase D family protein [Proteobacteria bacterium]|nr:alkaline phosphatase D family protein [Pseudomonadota bacterium]